MQKLFVDTEVVEWIDKQPAEVKQKYRKNKANALSDEWWHRTEVSCWGGISPSPPHPCSPHHTCSQTCTCLYAIGKSYVYPTAELATCRRYVSYA